MLIIYDEDRAECIRSNVDIKEQRSVYSRNTHQISHSLVYKCQKSHLIVIEHS